MVFPDYLLFLLIAVYMVIALFLKIINEKLEFCVISVDGMKSQRFFSWLLALLWPIWFIMVAFFAAIAALAVILSVILLIFVLIVMSFIKK